MTPATISLSQAKAKLSALVNEVAYGHKHFLILSHGRAKAMLVPVENQESWPQSPEVPISGALARARKLIQKLRRRGVKFDVVRDLEDLRSGKNR